MKPQSVDWDALAPHYRAGIRALRDIGLQFGVSDAGIIKHANKNKWTRDLKGKIKARADAKVSAAMVSAEVSAEAKLTEAVVVEVEAQVAARIRLAHRGDIGKARVLSMRLLDELDAQCSAGPEMAALFDLVHASGDGDKSDGGASRLHQLRQQYERVIGLSSRTKTMKELADSLRVLIALEREAFSLDGDSGGLSDYESRVADMRDGP